MRSSILTQTEVKLAESLTTIALANAASAFSMMTNDRVTFKKIGFNARDFLSNASKEDDTMVLLFTPFIGNVLFDSYLVISRQDAEKIAATMLPESLKGNESMIDATLLELDNILSAAIATKCSNLLGMSIAGDVPRHYQKSYKELKKHLIGRAEHFDSCYSCNTRFKLAHTKAQAEYVFFFQESFGQTLTELSVNQTTVKDIHYQANNEAGRFVG